MFALLFICSVRKLFFSWLLFVFVSSYSVFSLVLQVSVGFRTISTTKFFYVHASLKGPVPWGIFNRKNPDDCKRWRTQRSRLRTHPHTTFSTQRRFIAQEGQAWDREGDLCILQKQTARKGFILFLFLRSGVLKRKGGVFASVSG